MTFSMYASQFWHETYRHTGKTKSESNVISYLMYSIMFEINFIRNNIY